MIKKLLILKDKNIMLRVHTDFLEFSKDGVAFVISYKFISSIYLNKQANIALPQLVKLAKKVPLFFIDFYGNIVAQMSTDV